MRYFSSSLRSLLPGAALLACGLATISVQAQTADRKTAVGGYVSLMQYHGDLGNDFWKLHWPEQVGGGGHISRYLSPSFDLSLQGNYETFRFVDDAAPYSEFTAKTTMLDLGLKLKLNNGHILKENFPVQPYLMAGGGLFISDTSVPNPGSFRNNIYAPEVFGAAGLRFPVSSVVSIDLQTALHYAFNDYNDGVNAGKLFDRYLISSLGLTFAFGDKDSDGDGVRDRRDKCPDTPAGVTVDVNGCPIDTDGDGVADYQDQCPTEKGVVALQGCPDDDNDGVANASDKCPSTPAGVRVDTNGCPVDSDGDGVADYLDKCPNTPRGVKVDTNGCPIDRDGDGVPDNEDRCPDRPGPASNKGCPEIKAEAKKILNEATKYINFDFNKATLKPSSFPKLDQMVQILNEYPDYSLSIAGHTDSKGADDYNLRLSYERAASARVYMLSKGISADRIESRGYGETKPIADNATEAGQALNRRVDFDPFLTGESNAAEVKYGAAPPEPAEVAPVKTAPVKKAPAKRAPAKRTVRKK
ncbi:MAG: OmpA family protein [Janthinobacterium lividum]